MIRGGSIPSCSKSVSFSDSSLPCVGRGDGSVAARIRNVLSKMEGSELVSAKPVVGRSMVLHLILGGELGVPKSAPLPPSPSNRSPLSHVSCVSRLRSCSSSPCFRRPWQELPSVSLGVCSSKKVRFSLPRGCRQPFQILIARFFKPTQSSASSLLGAVAIPHVGPGHRVLFIS